MHLIAITEIPNPFRKTTDMNVPEKARKGKVALEMCQKILAEPMPDYPSDEEDENWKNQEREFVRQQIINMAETGTCDVYSIFIYNATSVSSIIE